jgi:hypothetical protein
MLLLVSLDEGDHLVYLVFQVYLEMMENLGNLVAKDPLVQLVSRDRLVHQEYKVILDL